MTWKRVETVHLPLIRCESSFLPAAIWQGFRAAAMFGAYDHGFGCLRAAGLGLAKRPAED
jgi:hypothetical protein